MDNLFEATVQKNTFEAILQTGIERIKLSNPDQVNFTEQNVRVVMASVAHLLLNVITENALKDKEVLLAATILHFTREFNKFVESIEVKSPAINRN